MDSPSILDLRLARKVSASIYFLTFIPVSLKVGYTIFMSNYFRFSAGYLYSY